MKLNLIVYCSTCGAHYKIPYVRMDESTFSLEIEVEPLDCCRANIREFNGKNTERGGSE